MINLQVSVLIAAQAVRGFGLVFEPGRHPAQMAFFIVQHALVSLARGRGCRRVHELRAEAPVHSPLKDLREAEYLQQRGGRSGMAQVEGLVTAKDANMRQRESAEDFIPQPGMLRLFRGVPSQLGAQEAVLNGAHHAAEQQRAFQLALAVPIQFPSQVARGVGGIHAAITSMICADIFLPVSR